MSFLPKAASGNKGTVMNQPALITDNITEVLVKIIQFTQNRQKVLIRNINNIHRPGFVPADLQADEFSDSLSRAVDEHMRTGRLVLCDSENVKFGSNGSFDAGAVADEYARELREINPDEYLELQIGRLLENSLNQKAATELLRQKQEMIFTDV